MRKSIFILLLSLILTSCTITSKNVEVESNSSEYLYFEEHQSFSEFEQFIDHERFMNTKIPYLITIANNSNEAEIYDYSSKIMDNMIVFGKEWEPYHIENIDWTEDPYKHASWVLYYQSLNFIEFLNRAYKLTKDSKYLDKAEYFITSWIRSNPVDEAPKTDYTWNDHATANRTKNIIHFLSLYRFNENFDKAIFNEIVYSLYQHGIFLNKQSNYVESNHGIMQDQSLLEIALLFPDFPTSKTWYDTAILRIEDSLVRDVTSEGVHKEHSPFYHIYVQNLFSETNRFLEGMSIHIPKISDTVDMMDDYINYVITPTGHFPQVSDTLRVTNTRLTEYPSHLKDKIFPMSGVGFLRGKEPKNNDDIYLMFVNAYNSRVHKHKDELSFVLTVGKTDFFIDGGNESYNKGKKRSYFVSPFAHNTMVLDNLPWQFSNDKIGNPKIDSYKVGNDYSYIAGSHSLYEDVTLMRNIIKVNANTFIIHDRIDSRSNNHKQLKQIFNIGKDVSVFETSRGEYKLLSNIDKNYLELKTVNSSQHTVEKYFGSEEPFLAWQSHLQDQVHPITTLMFGHDLSESKDFYTIITVNGKSDIREITFDDIGRYYHIVTSRGTQKIKMQ